MAGPMGVAPVVGAGEVPPNFGHEDSRKVGPPQEALLPAPVGGSGFTLVAIGFVTYRPWRPGRSGR